MRHVRGLLLVQTYLDSLVRFGQMWCDPIRSNVVRCCN